MVILYVAKDLYQTGVEWWYSGSEVVEQGGEKLKSAYYWSKSEMKGGVNFVSETARGFARQTQITLYAVIGVMIAYSFARRAGRGGSTPAPKGDGDGGGAPKPAPAPAPS